MEEQRALALLELNQMVAKGHFIYASGLHGGVYVNKRRLYWPEARHDLLEICSAMADILEVYEPRVVIGPEEGAIVLAQLVSIELSSRFGRVVPWVPAMKDGSEFKIREDNRWLMHGLVAVVEDVTTTGATMSKVASAIERLRSNCSIVCFAVIVDRTESGISCVESVPVRSIVRMQLNQWKQEECPLCKDGTPVNTDLGQGVEFTNNPAWR